MIRIVLMVMLVVINSCSQQITAPSEVTMDSGRPMSDGLKAYDVDHYTLRNDIQIEQKSISGSSAIRFVALTDMEVLELDFDGRYTIDLIEDGGGPLYSTRDEAKLYVTLRSPLSRGSSGERRVT